MDKGSRLAFRALVSALRETGQFGSIGMAVLVDELRLAAGDARAALDLYEADALEKLSVDVAKPAGGQVLAEPVVLRARIARSRG